MYNNTYELVRKQNKYKNMKEYVTKMINVLSNSDALDNLSMSQTYLKSYYLINGTACKYDDISKQKEKISNCLSDLRIILNSINSKLNNIKEDIETMEEE